MIYLDTSSWVQQRSNLVKWNALCYTDQTFKLHYIYTYCFRFGWWVFSFLHTKCIHLQTAAASKISFQFNSVSHRVRFNFNGVSFSLHIKLPEICRQLMCIDGLLMEHTKGSKVCTRFRKKSTLFLWKKLNNPGYGNSLFFIMMDLQQQLKQKRI